MSAAAAELPPREAYRLWAATYDGENLLSTLDERATSILTPRLAGLRLLDAACGTARRLRFEAGAAPRLAAGVDLVFEMLLRARSDGARSRAVASGDLRRLPLRRGAFDVVWCRLAAGHLRDLAELYDELARVTRAGGLVVMTDFHAEAARRGHTRSFRDPSGATCVVEHHVHDEAAHERAAASAGLAFDARLTLAVGPDARPLYESAGSLRRYERDRGLPLLSAFRFRRGGRP